MTRPLEQLRSRLAGVSAFDWTDSPFGAVFCRELLVALRFQRYAMMLAAIAIALLAAIFYDLGRVAVRDIPQAEFVTNIIGLQCGALLLVLFLVIPALSAVTVAAEQHAKTEDMMTMALGDPLSFLAGKLAAMLALFTAFHLALVPFSVFTYFFAGIEVRSYFQITFMLYGTALCHSIIGIAISRCTPHPGRALFHVYVALFLTYVIPPWLAGQYMFARPTLAGSTVSWYLSPLPLLRDLLHSLTGWDGCVQFLGMQLLATAIVLTMCVIASLWIRLRHSEASDKPRRTLPMLPSRIIPPSPDWSNALYHKDCHTLALARTFWSVISFACAALCSVAFFFWSARYVDLVATPVTAGTALLIVLTPLLVLERCGKEMEPNSLLMLRVTRLSSEQTLLGKMLAVFRALLPITLGIALGSLLPLCFVAPESLTGGHPETPTTTLLLYQAALFPTKLLFLVTLCFACVRYRSPSATDLAIALVLSTLLAFGAEFLRAGLFETADWKKLGASSFLLLLVFQTAVIAFGSLLLTLISLLRFESVFDEGSDIFAVRHVDRSTY